MSQWLNSSASRKRRKQEDIRRYILVDKKRKADKIERTENVKKVKRRRTKTDKGSCNHDNSDGYVPATTLTNGIRQKTSNKENVSPEYEKPTELIKDTDHTHFSEESLARKHQSQAGSSQSHDTHVIKAKDQSSLCEPILTQLTELTPLSLSINEQLSDDSLIAILNCNTEDFLAQL